MNSILCTHRQPCVGDLAFDWSNHASVSLMPSRHQTSHDCLMPSRHQCLHPSDFPSPIQPGAPRLQSSCNFASLGAAVLKYLNMRPCTAAPSRRTNITQAAECFHPCIFKKDSATLNALHYHRSDHHRWHVPTSDASLTKDVHNCKAASKVSLKWTRCHSYHENTDDEVEKIMSMER